MEIPAIYSIYKGGEVKTASVSFEGERLLLDSEPEPLEFYPRDEEERTQVMVADVRGLNKRQLDDRLLTNVKMPGSDIWYLTFIEDIEDVFDSFMGDIAKILIPYHTVRNGLVLREAFDVSDNSIPVAFVSNGRVLSGDENTKDIRTVLEELTAVGFTEIVVFDTDAMLTKEDWSSIGDRFSGAIPYVKGKTPEFIREMGFRDIISDVDP